MFEHLADGAPVDAEMPRRLALAHAVAMTGASDLRLNRPPQRDNPAASVVHYCSGVYTKATARGAFRQARTAAEARQMA
jgi:hypothetical protein